MSTVRALREAPETTEPKLFGPGSAMWDDMGDTLWLALSPGAFMLQGMHPTISAAVDRFSVFRTDPGGRAIRSLDSMMFWVYGGQEAITEGDRLRKLHQPIFGQDDEGERFSALDPEAYSWVHCTAFVTSVKIHPYVRGRELKGAELERSYDEFLQLGDILRVPRRMVPDDIDSYWDYYRTIVNDRLARTKVADELVERTLHPTVHLTPRGLPDPGGWVASRAAAQVLRLLTFGGMTEDALDVLGVRWTSADERALRALFSVARPIHQRLPEQLRYVAMALHARRLAREVGKARARETTSVA